MKIENFEFIVDRLSAFVIEEKICDHCRIGDPNSSNLKPFINEAERQIAIISASNGSVSCHIIAYKIEENKYTVSVTNIDITKRK